jgi:hypothetical protein
MNLLDDSFKQDADIAVSICDKCAKHPSLKRLVCSDAITGLCCLCGIPDAKVRNTKDLTPMVMLIRSLIRFYWDETSYNSHWGGDQAIELFDRENPVLLSPATQNYRDEFHFLVEEPPYPNSEKGVSIYAGFDQDGSRLLNTAISSTDPQGFRAIQRRLLKENFFVVAPDLAKLISPFIDDIELTLPEGGEWIRARLGQKGVFRREGSGFHWETVYQPWMNEDIGAPPPLFAGNGRLNRTGVSMLYLASNERTAVAEIRPHPGHAISVGGFYSKSKIRVADFNPDIALFASSDVRLAQYAIIHAFDRLMSTPVTPEDKQAYLITQLLSEVLIGLGFDGVRYRSSVSKGDNICVFYPNKFEFKPNLSVVLHLNSVQYDTTSLSTIIDPSIDDYSLTDRA